MCRGRVVGVGGRGRRHCFPVRHRRTRARGERAALPGRTGSSQLAARLACRCRSPGPSVQAAADAPRPCSQPPVCRRSKTCHQTSAAGRSPGPRSRQRPTVRAGRLCTRGSRHTARKGIRSTKAGRSRPKGNTDTDSSPVGFGSRPGSGWLAGSSRRCTRTWPCGKASSTARHTTARRPHTLPSIGTARGSR